MRYREKNQRTYSRPTVTAEGLQSKEATHSGVYEYETRSLNFDYPVGKFEFFEDVVVSNFQSRSAKGEIFNNPMNSYKEERDPVEYSSSSYYTAWQSGDIAVAHRHTPYYYTKTCPDDPAPLNAIGKEMDHVGSNIDVSSLRTLAGTQAAANVESPVFQGAVFIAELRETIGFLRNPLKGWETFARSALRSKRSRKSLNHISTSEFIADNWLRYRYGVRPLIHDTQEAIEAIKQTVAGFVPERKTARGTASSSNTRSVTGLTTNGYYESTTESEHTVSVRAGVLYEASRHPDTFGVGIDQIPSAIWEAIPYSFVVDWFANIGTFIEAIRPQGSIKRLASWTTVTHEISSTRNTFWKNGGLLAGRPRVVTADGNCKEGLRSTSKRRSPTIDVGLAFKTHPFEGDIGSKRILDSLALTTQILRSK